MLRVHISGVRTQVITVLCPGSLIYVCVLPHRAAVHSAYNQNLRSAGICSCDDDTAVSVNSGFELPVWQHAF